MNAARDSIINFYSVKIPVLNTDSLLYNVYLIDIFFFCR